MRLIPEIARITLDKLMLINGMTVNTMAKDMRVSWVTLNRFLKEEAAPQTNTYLKILDYIERNKYLLRS